MFARRFACAIGLFIYLFIYLSIYFNFGFRGNDFSEDEFLISLFVPGTNPLQCLHEDSPCDWFIFFLIIILVYTKIRSAISLFYVTLDSVEGTFPRLSFL